MPWCEECSKYWAPSAMNDDGTCPSCGRTVEAPKQASIVTAKNLDLRKLAAGDETGDGDDDARAPWHFKLLLVLLVIYLVYRFIDIIFL